LHGKYSEKQSQKKKAVLDGNKVTKGQDSSHTPCILDKMDVP
jgi:hypothetical protein